MQPVLYRLGALFIGALDALLWGATAAGEVLADAANLQPDTELLLNELTHSSPTSKAEIHLELLGALVDDQELNGVLLDLAEHSAIA